MKFFSGFDFVVHPLCQTSNSLQSDLFSECSDDSSSSESLRLPQHRAHHWTAEQRTILCLLEKWFISGNQPENQTSTIRGILKVLRAYFESESFETQRSLHNLSTNAVAAQLHEIWQKGKSSKDWRTAYQETDFADTKGTWSVTKQEFKDIIAELGIDLVERSSENRAEILARMGNGLRKKKRRRIDAIHGVLGQDVDLDTEEGERVIRRKRNHVPALPLTPKRRAPQIGLITPPTSPRSLKSANLLQRSSFRNLAFRAKYQAPRDPTHTQSPTPAARRSAKGVSSIAKRSVEDIPPVVFRVNDDRSHTTYQASSGFCAGGFSGPSTEIPPPPESTSDTFREAATIHLRSVLDPSSFISVSESPLKPISRGLQSISNAHISIIDLNYIYAHEQPDRPRRLYSAPTLIRQFRIGDHIRKNGKPYYYNGKGEWIVWGKIEKAAIMANFSMAEFERYMAQYPRIRNVLRLDAFRKCYTAQWYRRVIGRTRLPLSLSAGTTIGHFLGFTGLPLAHLDYTALRFARSWQFIGIDSQSREQSYLKGAHIGFRAFHSQSILPPEDCDSDLSVALSVPEAEGIEEDMEVVEEEEEEEEEGSDGTVDEDSDGTVLGDDFDDFMAERKRIAAVVGKLIRI